MRPLITFISFILLALQVNSQSISTLSLSQNDGDEGVMFDVFVKNDVVLNGISAQLEASNQDYDIHVYYKVGSYNSPATAPTTPGDWTLFASTGTIMSDASGNPTVLPFGGATLALTGGTTYGFYIENVLNGSNLSLNQGITTGTMAVDNTTATLFSGYEINGNSSGSISFDGLDNPNITFIGELFFANQPAISSVPTLNQWGLIVLALLFLIIGLISLTQKKSQLIQMPQRD